MPTDSDDDDSAEAVVLNPAQPLETVRAIQLLLTGSDDDGDEGSVTISDQVRAGNGEAEYNHLLSRHARASGSQQFNCP